MKTKAVLILTLLLLLANLAFANECTDNSGICALNCPDSYVITQLSCAPAVSPVCCIPTESTNKSNSCLEKESNVCSILNFNDPSLAKYTPEDYGLKSLSSACPNPLKCYERTFNTYNGPGNYSLSPGDEVLFEEGYTVKYLSFHRQTSWTTRDGTSNVGNIASLYSYKGNVDYSNSLSENLISTIANINDKDTTSTFNKGFFLKAQPVSNNGNLNVEIFTGSLSSCTDSDSYMGNFVPEEISGKWGRNYFKKGLTIELKEDINGQAEIKKEDICSKGKLTEYYCNNGQLDLEERDCDCLDDSTCKKGIFDSISEWFGRTFGNLK